MKNFFYKVVLCLFVSVFFSVGIRAQITASIDANATTCGLNNGTAEVYPQNGTGYTYQWSTGTSTTDTITNLAAGNYTVTVYNTANHADSIVKTFTIAGSGATTISVTAAHDTICLGSSEWLVAHGAASGTYTWSGGTLVSPVTGDSISVSTITPGSYTYTLSWGTNGCASATYTVVSRDVSATYSNSSQPSCGQNNGKINYNISNPNFTTTLLRNDTLVEHGSQTQFQNLPPGTYLFIVSDPSSGCADTLSPVVLVDNSVYPTFSNIQITPELCFGDNKGSIYVTIGNCPGGCTYAWSQSVTDHSDSAVNLAAGSYTFSVTGGGCTNIDTTIIVPGPSAALTDSLIVHPDHCGHNVGSAMTTVSGGTGPFTYTWSMGTNLGDSVAQLSGDSTLHLTVTDSHNCTVTSSALISTTLGPSAVLTPSDSICPTESNGVLSVTPVSGVGPFSYLWSNGQTTNVDAGLAIGAYTVTVYDAVGCDTVLHGSVPYYLAALNVTQTPPSGVTQGQTVVINLNPNVPVTSVTWSPYIQGSTDNTEVGFVPQHTDTETVILTYGQSCKIYDTIVVEVAVDTGFFSKWSIPNTFTPNADGINDNFKVISSPDLSFFHIWIFDRWGNKVYESTDVGFLWDGLDQFAGNKPLNTGVFSYVIEYQEVNKDSKGNIGGNISLVK